MRTGAKGGSSVAAVVGETVRDVAGEGKSGGRVGEVKAEGR